MRGGNSCPFWAITVGKQQIQLILFLNLTLFLGVNLIRHFEICGFPRRGKFYPSHRQCMGKLQTLKFHIS